MEPWWIQETHGHPTCRKNLPDLSFAQTIPWKLQVNTHSGMQKAERRHSCPQVIRSKISRLRSSDIIPGIWSHTLLLSFISALSTWTSRLTFTLATEGSVWVIDHRSRSSLLRKQANEALLHLSWPSGLTWHPCWAVYSLKQGWQTSSVKSRY